MPCMEQYVTEVSAMQTGQPATGCFGSDTAWDEMEEAT